MEDNPPADATKGKHGHFPVEVNTDPPPWGSEKLLVPGQRHVVVKAPPNATFRVLRDCFDCKVIAEVDKEAWALRITAFLDYEAVRLEVKVYRNAKSEAHTDLVFHHTNQDDLVLFGHVCSIAIDHLSTSRLPVLESDGTRSFFGVLLDGEFYDDPFEFEVDWPTMFASMLKAAGSPAAPLREKGLQALVRYAERKQDCIPALTDALLEHSELVVRLLQAPLAECYPLAVILKFVFGCPQHAERLALQILPLIPWPQAGLPSLVVHELEEAFGNLTMSVLANKRVGKATKRLEVAMKAVAEAFSRASTCEPSTISTYEFSELGEEAATDLLIED